MKKLAFVALLGVLATSSGWAQVSARSALQVLAQQRGRAVASQVVQVRGAEGQDQPEVWEIIAREPRSGRLVSHRISGGRLEQERWLEPAEALALNGRPLNEKFLRVDSTNAFAAADAAARKAQVGFDSIDYELRNRELSQEPIWNLTLNDRRGQPVGEITLAARTGAVLKSVWTGAPAPAVVRNSLPAAGPAAGARGATPAPASAGGDEGVGAALERARQSLQQGRDSVRQGLVRGRDYLRDAFQRWRGAEPSSSGSDWEEGYYDSGRR